MGLWGGRFSESADEALRKLNDSISFDQRMYAEDIAGSIAYARAIASAGVITPDEAEQIIDGLGKVKAEFDQGDFVFVDGDEDIHTAVERRMTELVGPVGGKLHTGRSRNDQVATDFRLWVMAAVDRVSGITVQLQQALIVQAEQHLNTLMPGYTHMQPAQPITVAHWLMSFFWMLERDQQRCSDAKKRTSVMPLGSGALAGTPLDIDREALAIDLGFEISSQNSLDSVSDRDFAAETLFAFALMGVHLSRLAEDIVLFSNPAFGFISLNDRYSTGSSLMPQKRNADPMELTRGKAGRLIGHLAGLMTTLKGLPSGYNKDLQEDKEVIFDAFDSLNNLLPIITAIILTLKVNPENLKAALREDMLATDLADHLVHKGMPFREAHHVVGQVVQWAENHNCQLSEVPLVTLREISTLFGSDVTSVFSFDESVKKRAVYGGTAPDAVRLQIEQAKQLLDART